MLNVTVPLTVLPAIASVGIDTDVVTSARGETVVVADEISGSVFGPWLVDVPIPAVIVTDPEGGATNVTPIVNPDPAPRLAGIPAKVTAPVAAS